MLKKLVPRILSGALGTATAYVVLMLMKVNPSIIPILIGTAVV